MTDDLVVLLRIFIIMGHAVMSAKDGSGGRPMMLFCILIVAAGALENILAVSVII